MKAAGSEENTIRAGKGYGSRDFWEKYAHRYGWQAVPSDVVKQLHSAHATEAAKRAAAQAQKAGGSGHTTIGKVEIILPNVKTAADAHQIAAVLRDPRSVMSSAPPTARTHPSIPMVLSVRTA